MNNIVSEVKRFVDANGNWSGSASEMIEQGFSCAAPNRLSRDISSVKADLDSLGIKVETGKKQGKRFIQFTVDGNNSIVQSVDNPIVQDSIVQQDSNSIVQLSSGSIVHNPIVQDCVDDKTMDSIVHSTTDNSIVQFNNTDIDALTESDISYNIGGEYLPESELIPVPENLTFDEIFHATKQTKNRWRCPERCAELFYGFCGLLGEKREAVYSECVNFGVPVKGEKIRPAWAIHHYHETKKQTAPGELFSGIGEAF